MRMRFKSLSHAQKSRANNLFFLIIHLLIAQKSTQRLVFTYFWLFTTAHRYAPHLTHCPYCEKDNEQLIYQLIRLHHLLLNARRSTYHDETTMMKPKHLRIKGISVMIHFTISQWAQTPRCIQCYFTVIQIHSALITRFRKSQKNPGSHLHGVFQP